ncbi:glycosyltransferase family 4 protein [Noviherbaspirillum sp. Root189]|uniref:glycosyltransferase family 4 protein n=1 Tax=Noviherbaspirillum sp. Root189 TaxID=1736487 RepID=UPI001F2018A5|nr:glycosyltransferase family 4 protein [Noviherbaspirillum sp. Root189]
MLTSCLGRGGAERVASILCNAWAERGDEVSLIATFSGGGKAFYDISPSVETIFLADVVGSRQKNIGSYFHRLLTLRKLIAARKPDVVVSFLPNVNVAAIAATAMLGIPVVVCERSDPSARSPRDFWEMCCKATYRFADMLIVQTENVASKVTGIYPGLRAVRCIPNPLPPTILPLRKSGGTRKILLSLGRLSPEKQVDQIIDAFAEVAGQASDWDLHIYGDGPEKPALAARIRRLGLQDRAFLKGATKESAKVMAGADAFMMASKYEGFPNALLEAMAAGLPCIAADCESGPREMTRNGKDALLVPVGNRAAMIEALSSLVDNAPLRMSLGGYARQSVLARYSLHSVLSAWDEVFAAVGAIPAFGGNLQSASKVLRER